MLKIKSLQNYLFFLFLFFSLSLFFFFFCARCRLIFACNGSVVNCFLFIDSRHSGNFNYSLLFSFHLTINKYSFEVWGFAINKDFLKISSILTFALTDSLSLLDLSSLLLWKKRLMLAISEMCMVKISIGWNVCGKVHGKDQQRAVS